MLGFYLTLSRLTLSRLVLFPFVTSPGHEVGMLYLGLGKAMDEVVNRRVVFVQLRKIAGNS